MMVLMADTVMIPTYSEEETEPIISMTIAATIRLNLKRELA